MKRISELDSFYNEWQKTAEDNRYKFIRKFKEWLRPNLHLKSEKHRIFPAMIIFHLDKLETERKELQTFLNRRMDQYTDGLSYYPTNTLESFNLLNASLADRINAIYEENIFYKNELEKY